MVYISEEKSLFVLFMGSNSFKAQSQRTSTAIITFFIACLKLCLQLIERSGHVVLFCLSICLIFCLWLILTFVQKEIVTSYAAIDVLSNVTKLILVMTIFRFKFVRKFRHGVFLGFWKVYLAHILRWLVPLIQFSKKKIWIGTPYCLQILYHHFDQMHKEYILFVEFLFSKLQNWNYRIFSIWYNVNTLYLHDFNSKYCMGTSNLQFILEKVYLRLIMKIGTEFL